MKKTVLRKYAQLIAQTGVNVQPGQEVFIAADLDQPEFVKMLVEECYKRRAKKVVVDWSYQPLQKLHYRYRTPYFSLGLNSSRRKSPKRSTTAIAP